MKWRLLDTGSNNAYFNMAVDEAIVKIQEKNPVSPTVRFYQWMPAGLSLGYFQNINKEIDINICKENNVDIVRRLTGGRAVLHDKELTYSLILSEKYNYLPKSVLDSYKIISKGILTAFHSLGIEAELKGVEKNKKAPKGFSSACFDAPSWYEVVVNNKKLVGSAQARKNGVILQHGSIPFDMDVDLLFKLLKSKNEKSRERMKRRFLNKATTVNWLVGEKIKISQLKKALIDAWEKEFAITLVEGELSFAEKQLVDKLIADKYITKQWNNKY